MHAQVVTLSPSVMPEEALEARIQPAFPRHTLEVPEREPFWLEEEWRTALATRLGLWEEGRREPGGNSPLAGVDSLKSLWRDLVGIASGLDPRPSPATWLATALPGQNIEATISKLAWLLGDSSARAGLLDISRFANHAGRMYYTLISGLRGTNSYDRGAVETFTRDVPGSIIIMDNFQLADDHFVIQMANVGLNRFDGRADVVETSLRYAHLLVVVRTEQQGNDACHIALSALRDKLDAKAQATLKYSFAFCNLRAVV